MSRSSVPAAAPVTIHDPPPTKYSDVIARAKAGAVPDRPGNMKGTPSFEGASNSWESREAPKTQLSAKTAAGIVALQQAQPPAPQNTALPEELTDPVELEASKPAEAALSDDEKLRKAVEGRITDRLDIGQYLMNGEVTQVVPVIPGKLEITFRSVTDLEEAFVDSALSKNREMTTREFVRSSNEYALAFHIVAVNGTRWPQTVVDGKVNETAIEKRITHVRKLSSPIFLLLTQNLGWFLERVSKGLTLEVLGNG